MATIKSILDDNNVKLSPVSAAAKLIKSNGSEADICRSIVKTKAYQVAAVKQYVDMVIYPPTPVAEEEKKASNGRAAEPPTRR